MRQITIPAAVRRYAVVMLLLLPVFFSGIRDTHDWGDDFAIYLQGALNLSRHRPVNETKYVWFAHYNARYPPASVPVGFPLLLAPLVKWPADFRALNYYMSLWLYLFAIATFAFLRRHLGRWAALGLTLIFFLNPAMIAFKSEVISDLPFSFFSALVLLLCTGRRQGLVAGRGLLLGLAVAMQVAIRSIGWCTVLCLSVDALPGIWRALRAPGPKAAALQAVGRENLWLGSFAGLYALLGLLAGGHSGGSMSFYTSSYSGIHVWELLMANLNIYILNFQSMFDVDAGLYGFGTALTRSAMLFCFAIGLLDAFSKGYNKVLLYFVVYSAAILLSPFNNQGFRFFFPLYPVILLYIANGARSISAPVFSRRLFWAAFLTVLILLQYKEDLWAMYQHRSEPIYPTPVSAACREGFRQIHALTSDSDLILCLKPRACALFADRRFCVQPDGVNTAGQEAALSISRPSHLLVIKEIDNDRIDSLARYERDTVLYEDARFRLYKRR